MSAWGGSGMQRKGEAGSLHVAAEMTGRVRLSCKATGVGGGSTTVFDACARTSGHTLTRFHMGMQRKVQ